MSFLAPSFVAFALLAGVPIAIHLIGRRRARIRHFAPIDLLLRAERRVARRTKLTQLLLLSVRALAIAAVPLMLAKPYVQTEGDLPAAVSTAQSAVIIVDDSLSMSLKLGGTPLFERARERARRILAALGPEADVALLLGSRGAPAPVPELSTDRLRVERALGGLKPSYRATDLGGALKRAAQMLESASRPVRNVYLVSDMAAHGFDRDPPWAAGRGPHLVPIDVSGSAARGNRALTDLRIEPAPQLGPRGVRVSVEAANFSATAARQVRIGLRVDGKAVARGLLDLPPWEKSVKRFFHLLSRGGDSGVGVHEVIAELEPDQLAGDDRRYARLDVERDLRVLVVDGDVRPTRRLDEVFYLETALRPGEGADAPVDLAITTPDELGRRRLGDYDVIFFCNVKAGAASAELRDFVLRGGGLFISVGDNVEPEAYNSALGDLLPAPLEGLRTVGASLTARSDGEVRASGEGEHIGRIDRRHPVMAPFAGARDDALKEARFGRYILLRPSAASGDRQVLMQFTGGAPALVEKRLGSGRVLFFASTIDRDWNDLVIQPGFLPLVQQATRYLARAPMKGAEPALQVGQRHEIPLGEGDTRVEVTLPSGRKRLFEKDRVIGRRALGFGETDEPGIYRVAIAGPDGALQPRPQAAFAVNTDPAESNLSPISPERLAQLAAGGGARVARAPLRRVELWHGLGAALLLLLLFEGLLLRAK